MTLLTQGEKEAYSPPMPHRDRSAFAVAVSHEQRDAPSRAETLLWTALRNRGLGVKFRRQAPLGRYVVDFVCMERRLIVECDGPHHREHAHRVHDAERDAWLSAEGFTVIRLADELVVGATEIAVQRIKQAFKD